MTRPLFTQSIELALASGVGAAGADDASYGRWRDKAQLALTQVRNHPSPELSAILSLPTRIDDLEEIESIATEIAEHYTDLVVVGMGGSSLGGEVLAALRQQGGLVLHFVDNIDPLTIEILIEGLPWQTTAFLVVSKSGNTVELQALLAVFIREAKARGVSIAKHFTALTIPNQNPLHQLALDYGMRVVAHDADVCGRFSILSSVGLIPAAAVGVDIRAFRTGAELVLAQNFAGDGAAIEAAALHMAFYDEPRLQVMMHYCDRLGGVALWHRQCWAESLGKHAKATTPIRSRGATDQHSQLQLYLAGPRDKLFTSLMIDTSGQGAAIDYVGSNDTRLQYLQGHRLGDLFMAEQRATNDTLVKEGCPLRTLTLDRLDETVLGGLLMHFTLEIVLVAEMLGINAFDQPAVEAGKRLTLEYLSSHAG